MTELTDHNIPNAASTTGPAPICWIETVSGKRVDLRAPDPAQICIEDIAWSLSRQPCFGGHTIHWEPLSLAAHCQWVGVYLWAQTRNHTIALHGLLHAAHAAYTGNLPTPLKHLPVLRQEIHRVEQQVQATIYRALQVPPVTEQTQQLIARANEQALAIEARLFMHSGARGWGLPEPDAVAFSIDRMLPVEHRQACRSFLTSFKLFSIKLKRMH